jgi:membrane-bound lytic murein transglycosylase A
MSNRRRAAFGWTGGGALVAFAALAVFAWWLFRAPEEAPAPPAVSFAPAGIGDLPGWRDDDLAGFRRALETSCARWPKRSNPAAGTMARACAALPDGDAALKAHLAAHWRAWRVETGDGRLTGYFEPVYRGSRTPDDEHAVPLHRVPDDLVTARLGDFDPELEGRRIAGRVQDGRLRPYHDRRAIREGALAGRGLELLWLADPVDAFFLQIQGSGRIVLPDGGIAYVGYAGQNGHAYRAIGRDLIRLGEVPRERMSMQAIRDWLADNPSRADGIMDLNRSYVFFTERDREGAIGAEGVVLTPERSIAVDRRLWHFGLPFWIDAGPDLRRLTVGQDTGGAIRGPARADLFLGPGEAAGERAGRMNEPLALWLLLPADADPAVALR